MALTENKKKVAELLVLGDKSQSEIAKEVGINQVSISRFKHDKDFCEYYEKLEQELTLKNTNEAKRRLATNTNLAIDTLLDLMQNSDSDNVRYQCATRILDYTVGKPTSKQEIKVEKTETKQEVSADDMADKLLSLMTNGNSSPVFIEQTTVTDVDVEEDKEE